LFCLKLEIDEYVSLIVFPLKSSFTMFLIYCV